MLLQAVCLLAFAILGFSGLLEAAATHGPPGRFQDTATAYLDRSEQKAIEAFAAARAINAGISLLKSAEFSPIIARIAPGQLLEPVDDLAKQFSDVMVVSIIAILLQRLLLMISEAWALTIALPVGCILWLLALSSGRRPVVRQRLNGIGRSVVILALFARLVVPVAAWIGDGITQRFLASDLNGAITSMNAARGSLDQFKDQAIKPDKTAASSPAPPAGSPPAGSPPARPSWWTWLDNAVTSTARTATDAGEAVVRSAGSWIPNWGAILGSINAATEALKDLPNQFVTATEIFLVQTILTPLIVAMLLYGALRGLTRPIGRVRAVQTDTG
jgi:hypothetical protein